MMKAKKHELEAAKVIPFPGRGERPSVKHRPSKDVKGTHDFGVKISFKDIPCHAVRVLNSNINGYNRFKGV